MRRWCSDPRAAWLLLVSTLAVLELGLFAAFVFVAREAGHGWRSTVAIAGVATWVVSKLMRSEPRCLRCQCTRRE